MNLPTSPLVAEAWVKSIPGFPAGVATVRPADAETWSATGFVVVSVVGSAGAVDLAAQRRPIVSMDAWGVSINSSKPPRGQTANLLELIRAATEDFQPVLVTPGPTGVYRPALVQDAWMVTAEPREIPDPNASYAHFTADVGLAWVVAG